MIKKNLQKGQKIPTMLSFGLVRDEINTQRRLRRFAKITF